MKGPPFSGGSYVGESEIFVKENMGFGFREAGIVPEVYPRICSEP
jgi:hypothetical protein